MKLHKTNFYTVTSQPKKHVKYSNKSVPTERACVVVSEPVVNAILTETMLTIACEASHQFTNFHDFHTDTTFITDMRIISCEKLEPLNSF